MMNPIRTALFLAAAVTLVACAKLSEDDLQKIHNGMTTAEVKSILGSPTKSDASSAFGIISGTTYIYHTDTSNVKITFVDDKVIMVEGNFQ